MRLVKFIRRYQAKLGLLFVAFLIGQLFLLTGSADFTVQAASPAPVANTPTLNSNAPTNPDTAALNAAPAVATPTTPPAKKAYGKLPVSFEANQGQVDAKIKFMARGQGYTAYLTPSEVVLDLRKPNPNNKLECGDSKTSKKAIGTDDCTPKKAAVAKPEQGLILRMSLVGGNATPQLAGQQPQTAKTSYLSGKNTAKSPTDVANYGAVQYQAVYSNIDLTYYNQDGQLEYDFTVAPGADPNVITMRYEGISRLAVTASGDLMLYNGTDALTQPKPVIYQQINGTKQPVSGSYVVRGAKDIGFNVGSYDKTKPLIIDPVLLYSTYLGGSGSEYGMSVAVDSSGNAYVTGYTYYSYDFPTTSGAYQPNYLGGYDVFVTKLSADGSQRLYSTYLGGSGEDRGLAIAVDSSGNAYIGGFTNGTDFPTTSGAYQTTYGTGSSDGFLTKLNSSGTALIYSTYFGGSGNDYIYGLALDSSNNVYVTGDTGSSNFAVTSGAYRTTPVGSSDVFISKFNAAGSALVYSTYLGSTAAESGQAIAVDSAGSAYVTGYTQGSNFPTTTGAYRTTSIGGQDAFVTKLNAGGTALVFSTYLGGTGADTAQGIALDSSGNAFITGYTGSTSFPTTTGAYQTTHGGGGYDAFVTKFNSGGTGLVYSTFLGKNYEEFGQAIAVDANGNACITGYTSSSTFPTTTGAFQSSYGGNEDAFVTQLNASGTGLKYSSFLGGGSPDRGRGIALDSVGNIYLTGYTHSSNFPTSGGSQASSGGGDDAFVAKFMLVSLTFTTQPGGARAGGLLTPQPVVTVTAPDGSTITNLTGSVSLSIQSGTGTVGATLGGTTTVQLVNGVAAFTNVSINQAGISYIINASSTLLDPPSEEINIGPAGTTFNTGSNYFYNLNTPKRLYDSRKRGDGRPGPNNGVPLGGNGFIGAGTLWEIPTRQQNSPDQSFLQGLPSTATALLANITVDNATGNGFIAVNDTIQSTTTAVKWYSSGARSVSNFYIINIDSAGWFELNASGGISSKANIIIDVFGYVDTNSSGGVYKAINNSNFRLYDSRGCQSTCPGSSVLGRLTRGNDATNPNTRTIQVTGKLNIPSTATAVAVNLTAVGTSYGGYFGLYPTGGTIPLIASINWNDTTSNTNIPRDVGNLAIVPLDSNGRMNIVANGDNSASGADVVIDVQGYIDSNQSDNRYVALKTPMHFYDTGTCNGTASVCEDGQLSGDGATRTIQVAGPDAGNIEGLPAAIPSSAIAVVLHITLKDVGGSNGGFLAMYPSNISWPGNSSVNNNAPNQLIGNLAIIPISPDGKINIRNGGVSAKGFVLDILGYISPSSIVPSVYTCLPRHCYGQVSWRKSDGFIGAYTTIDVVAISAFSSHPDGTSSFLNNELWLVDDVTSACMLDGQRCWVEVGYKAVNNTRVYFWGEKGATLPYQRHIVGDVPTEDLGNKADFRLFKDGVNPGKWIIEIVPYNNASPQTYYKFTTDYNIPMLPRYSNIGQELTGYIGSSAPPANWTENMWLNTSYYQDYQKTAGAVWLDQPPYGGWVDFPDYYQGSNGGKWRVYCCTRY